MTAHIKSHLDTWASLSGNALKDAVRYCLEGKQDDTIRRYVMAVLDPSVTYGVKGKLRGGRGCEPFDFGGFELLQRLARRELTGNAAKTALDVFCDLHDDAAVELMNRALNKDLRCGVGATLINGLEMAFKIPVFACALAHPAEEKRLGKHEWYWATKYDGIRTLVEVNDSRVSFWTRSGKPIPRLQHLEKDALEVFGGMRVMLDAEGVGKTFLESVSSMRGHAKADDCDNNIVLMVFDMLHLDDFYKHEGRKQPFGAPLKERLENLGNVFREVHAHIVRDDERQNAYDQMRIQPIPHRPIENWDHAQRVFQEQLDAGQEGIMLRRADSPYTKERTYDWLKLKLEDTVDARITGVFEGQGKYTGMMGYVTVEVDGVVCQVGGGWSDWERAAAWAAATGEPCTYIAYEEGKPISVTVQYDEENSLIDRIIEIGFNGKMPSGALRHPRKYRFRDIEGEKA